MKKNFLEIKNIYKSYKLGETNFSSFTEDVKVFFNKNIKKKNTKLILRNCSIYLKKGDSVAILGKNGAGKSTLLKIISKIAYPDQGYVRCKGKIASMLSIVNWSRKRILLRSRNGIWKARNHKKIKSNT